MSIKLPRNCFVVTTKNPKSIYALHTKTNSRIVCFKNLSSAQLCENSLAFYRNKYGKWPRRLVQNNSFNDIELLQKDRPSLLECQNLLEIQYAETKQMLDFCNTLNIGMIMCDNFDINEGALRIKGIQLEESILSNDEKIKIIETMYEIS